VALRIGIPLVSYDPTTTGDSRKMCSSKNGVAAREIERKYNLTPKTAWFMLHRIREAMKREPMAGLLSGRVVADETFWGGSRETGMGTTRRSTYRVTPTSSRSWRSSHARRARFARA
jgi:hypothetical protein